MYRECGRNEVQESADTSTMAVLMEREIQDDARPNSASKENARLMRQSRFLAIGAVGIFSAYSGVANLQSSLNFDQSIGTTSLAIAFGTSILMNATVVPVLFELFCTKNLLLVSEFTFIVFTFANLYPAPYTLYPGAVMLGIGEAIIWPCITMFNCYFGSRSAETTNQGPEETSGAALEKKCPIEVTRQLKWRKIRWFTGKFFALFAVYQIIGNLMAFVIFTLGEGKSEAPDNSTSHNLTIVPWTETNDASHVCGAKDCYEYVNSGADASEKSVLGVQNVTLKYALFVGYGALQVSAMVFHKFSLDSITSYKENAKSAASIKVLWSFVTQLLRHMTSPLQLLLAPLNIYSGMMMGFLYGDFTRSFVTCPLGVKEVGLAMTFFGVSNVIGSMSFQWYPGSLGRIVFFVLFVLAEASLLLFAMIWEPRGQSPWEVYVLAACFGIPDSWRQATLSATYPEYFAGNENSAFSTLSLLTCAGYVIMFGIGTNVCVFNKIIFLLASLVFGFGCYIAAEYGIHRRCKYRKQPKTEL